MLVLYKSEIPAPDHASKKAIHEERSHSDTHKDKDDNRGTLLRMGSCIDERDTCHDQTRKENESRASILYGRVFLSMDSP